MTADRSWGRVQTIAAPNLCWPEPILSDVKTLLRDDGALEGDLNSTNTLTAFNFSGWVRVLVTYKAKDSGAIKEGGESRHVIAALPLVPEVLRDAHGWRQVMSGSAPACEVDKKTRGRYPKDASPAHRPITMTSTSEDT